MHEYPVSSLIVNNLETCLPFVGSVGIPLDAVRDNPLHCPIFLSLSSPHMGAPIEVMNKVLEFVFSLSPEYLMYLQYLRQLEECTRREDVILLECLLQPPSTDLFQQSSYRCTN